jgi:hypothetical protein
MIDPGDVKQILRNRRIANGLFGAGLGSGAGYLLGQTTGLYDPWKGALAGGLVGAGAGVFGTKNPYDEAEILNNSVLMSQPGALVPYKGYWFAPSIGGAALGLAASSSATDNPYAIAASGAAGFLGGRALDNYMLTHTKFPTFR